MPQQGTILLTGFGPFPGTPHNASALLAPKLAHLAARRFYGHRVVARVLPTEWESAPARLAELYAREEPKLALHFGVSERARGFVVETLARNERCLVADARGETPLTPLIASGGPTTLASPLPGEAIVARLRAIGIPATLSEDAGAYLCNAVLYGGLLLAGGSAAPPAVGFVHIPRDIVRSGKPAGRTGGGPGVLGWEHALQGGLEIIRVCLGRPAPVRKAKPRVKPR